MKVKEIMALQVETCSPESSIASVAMQMLNHECGIIPVVADNKPIGVITDRDIAMRVVAEGKQAGQLCARDAMSNRLICVNGEMSIDGCCGLLGQHKLRRLPVVAASGEIIGIVSVADIAKHSDPHETGRLMKLICEPEQALV